MQNAECICFNVIRSSRPTCTFGIVSDIQIDNREFTVTGAIDSLTARRIDAAEARSRHIIVDGATGPRSPSRVRSPTSPRNRVFESPGRETTPDDGPGLSSHDEDGFDFEYYLNEANGERIPLLQAIAAGWVFVEYEHDQQNMPPDIQVLSHHHRHRRHRHHHHRVI